MVYIYGGGFTYGHTTFYGPDFFMEHDELTLVTVNYRLGALGFLSIADPQFGIPGNAGLKDQRLALHWVRDNIRQFGGNPASVTLFGQSAGAASVHFHLMSDQSNGLFHRGILQSGSALSPWATTGGTATTEELNHRLATALGWRSGLGGTTEMMRILRSADPSDIVRAQSVGTPTERSAGRLFDFVPTIEPYDGESCFLCRTPAELLRSAWGNSIPVMTGATSGDGHLLLKYYLDSTRLLMKWDDINPLEKLFPWSFIYPMGHPDRAEWAERMRDVYNVTLPLSEANWEQLIPIVGDKLLWQGVADTIRSRFQAENDAGPIYLYRFNYEAGTNLFMKKLMSADLGRSEAAAAAVHCEDLMYLWNIMNVNAVQSENDLSFSRYLVSVKVLLLRGNSGKWNEKEFRKHISYPRLGLYMVLFRICLISSKGKFVRSICCNWESK